MHRSTAIRVVWHTECDRKKPRYGNIKPSASLRSPRLKSIRNLVFRRISLYELYFTTFAPGYTQWVLIYIWRIYRQIFCKCFGQKQLLYKELWSEQLRRHESWNKRVALPGWARSPTSVKRVIHTRTEKNNRNKTIAALHITCYIDNSSYLRGRRVCLRAGARKLWFLKDSTDLW